MASILKEFEGVPLGLLVSQPIIEVARGQAELCNVYLDQLFRLAFQSMPDFSKGDSDPVAARVIKFTLNRPVVDTDTGATKIMPVTIEAPLLALVPVPAFTMEEATVNFTMEVKEAQTEKASSGTESDFSSSFSAWGFKAAISGKVTANREHTRSTDKTAKYEIFARAAQQPAAEGMAKLSTIFASVIEPIEAS